jgi:protein involved in polysaccharide export with SLBB domain
MQNSLFAWVALVLCICAVGMERRAERQLAPGDELHITFADQPEWNTDVKVAEDGSAAVPPLGRIRLAGLSRMLAETYVAEQLLSGDGVNPARVNIEVVQSAPLRLAEAPR